MGQRSRFLIGALLAAAFVATPAHAQNTYERLVIALLQQQHPYNDYERSDQPDWIGQLRRAGQERQVEHAIRLEAGQAYRIVGACDNDCTRMDLEVFNGANVKVGTNESFDDHPYVDITPEVSGTYRVHPWVVECRARPCYGGVRVLKREPAERGGTAFLISSSGYLLTAAHVVEDREKITIHTGTGDVPAQVVSRDPANDVALLKADLAGTPLHLASAGALQRGQEVMTLGYPLVDMQGNSQKASFGRVNALSGLQDDIRYVQVDVTIQPGNSGGPLLSADGNVVGIVTATINQQSVMANAGTVAQNVNYALKVDYVVPLLPPDARPAAVPPAAAGNFQETAARAEPSVFRITAE